MANEINVGARGLANVNHKTHLVEVVKKRDNGFVVRDLETGETLAISTLIDFLPGQRSLLEAAHCVLSVSCQPLNTRTLIKWIKALELYDLTGSKTPEQSLYAVIMYEIKTKEHPRIVRSDIRGKFIYGGEAW